MAGRSPKRPYLFKIFIFSVIVDLQCSVNFYCTAVTYTYIYTHTHIYLHTLFFSHFPPSCSITSDYIQFPVLYSRISLFIHSKYNSLHLLIPNSQSIPFPSPWQPVHPIPFPLATTSLFSKSMRLFLFYRKVHLGCILDSRYK